MKDGGFLYISVPSLAAAQVHGDLKYCINYHGHIMGYTADCLETVVTLAGLSIVRRPSDDTDQDRLARDERNRLRVFAQKRESHLVPPSLPLRAAKKALRSYRVGFLSVAQQLWATVLPVRLRASWLEGTYTRKLLVPRRRVGTG